jgi:uncharacterized protein (TIGR02466 family)
MKFDNVFPIPIARVSIDSDIIENSLQLVNNYISTSKCLEEDREPGELLTTFYQDNDKNFLGTLNDKKMLYTINDNARKFLNTLGFDPACFIEITSWLQLYPPTSLFNRHDHYGAIVSGVVYLQAPENSGNIMFYNPVEQRRTTNTFFHKIQKEENEFNYNHVEYTPIKGEMILFESWLQHSVKLNRSNDNRIAISFNIWGAPNES